MRKSSKLIMVLAGLMISGPILATTAGEECVFVIHNSTDKLVHFQLGTSSTEVHPNETKNISYKMHFKAAEAKAESPALKIIEGGNTHTTEILLKDENGKCISYHGSLDLSLSNLGLKLTQQGKGEFRIVKK